jgi:hypothetical protein
MDDSSDETIITPKTFRFASDQLLTLNEDQIEKIPYLAAIVSSGDRFKLARDKHGHYILDPHIEFKHFAYVLDSLSFDSIRQIFTHLPKQNDIIPIIALFDFLGIGPQPDPGLDEVDSMFFSNMVYSPMLENYLQIVRPSVIQDMAVRFAIAMVKEEYDFTNRKVIDQIYWFIMFILSAYQLFGDCLRHHVYTIAKHCFSLFEPSLLKPLKKLIRRSEKDTRKLLPTNNEDVSPDEENIRPLEQVSDIHKRSWLDEFNIHRSPTLKQRQELLLYRTYSYEDEDYIFYRFRSAFSEDTLLKPVHKRVLEIMYERLQSEISRHALIEIRRCPHKFLRNVYDEFWYSVSDIYRRLGVPTPTCLWEHNFTQKEIDEWILNDIFKHETVQEEIRECILEEVRELIPKLEKRHRELAKEIREYDQNREIHGAIRFHMLPIYRYSSTHFQYIQEEALSHELLLNKLHQHSIVVEQMRQYILKELYAAARKQINEWENVEREINELRQSLSSCWIPEESTFRTSKIVRQSHPIPTNKPLPKIQFKHSMR